MDVRISYEAGALDESLVAPDPLVQFEAWFAATVSAGLREPAAMTLATVGADGRPSARIVLLRGADERGLVFYTNYESRKGLDIAQRPDVALVFHWDILERQVRVEGRAAKLPPQESDAYFATRPRGHRLSAWASQQSRVVAGRAALEAQVAQCEARFAGSEVGRPPYWGGYRVTPARFEFWQGRRNRMHDRIAYSREGPGWRIERLSP